MTPKDLMKFTRPIQAKFLEISRLDLVASRHQGNMRILHMGCVDSGLLYERMKKKDLFHLKLIERFGQKLVYGIDYDKEGIAFLRKAGVDNLFFGDATRIDLEGRFDIVFAGEIIEHVPNPGQLLDNIKHLLIDGGELIITTPNAYFYWSFLFHVFGYESIHPDHNCVFSATSLQTLLRKRGYHTIYVSFGGERIDFSKESDTSLVKFGKSLIHWFDRAPFFTVKNWFPQLGPSLIVIARPADAVPLNDSAGN
jgi:SAM-dependent methyltransferase